jgi:hypothetical protein
MLNSGKRMFVATHLLDRAGMWASALCAIHCIALPMLVTISAFSGLVFLDDPRVENVIITATILLGTCSLFPSYFKHHRKIFPMLILLFGFFLIGLSRFMVHVNEPVLVSAGAALVASAHLLNYRICKIPITPDNYRGGREV